MLARKRGCVKTKTSVVPVALRWQETKELNPAVRAAVSLMDRTASLHAAGQDHARRVEFEDLPTYSRDARYLPLGNPHYVDNTGERFWFSRKYTQIGINGCGWSLRQQHNP